MPQDGELLLAWGRGSAAAGRTLFQTYFARVLRFFSRKVGEDAEDLVSETFTRCGEAAHRFRGEVGAKAFVFGVARNVLLEYLRGKAKSFDPLESSVEASTDSAATKIDQADDRRRLYDCLCTLPVELQLALELHYWEDVPVRELAELTGVPTGTVKSRLFRARRLLKEALEASPGPGPTDDALLESIGGKLESAS